MNHESVVLPEPILKQVSLKCEEGFVEPGSISKITYYLCISVKVPHIFNPGGQLVLKVRYCVLE